jgi:predicted phosphodiesterase
MRTKQHLLCLVCLTLAASAFGQVTRQPYLQVPTPDAITIRWQSGTGIIGDVYYGTSVTSLSGAVTESQDERIYHEVRVSNLRPHTKYYYSVDGTRKGNEDQYFVTAPVAGSRTPVRFWVISDFGQTNTDQNPRRLETVARWKSFNENDYHADLVLSLGDQTEDDAIYQLQHNYFATLQNILRSSPLYTTIGNHDYHDSVYNYLRTFTLPAAGEAGGVASGTEQYYAFDYANVHVVVLCSEIEDEAGIKVQNEWLRKDLEKNAQDWLIACVHQPFHSGGYHPTDEVESAERRRRDWLTVLEDHGVDLVLQGHNHAYERSYLLDNLIGKTATLTNANKIDAGDGREDGNGAYRKRKGAPHQGTIFMEVAAGGTANPASTLKHYPIFPVSFGGSDYEGSVVIDVRGLRMDGRFLCDQPDTTGSHVWDHFTILKTE